MEWNLAPLTPRVMTGDERFSVDGSPTDFDILEFWRWSVSDLVTNTTRGMLAEFIVAKALDIDVTRPRVGWATWDLDWPVSSEITLNIEVKSAAYLQSWGQKSFSSIQFVIPGRRGFDVATNEMETAASRHAHVYVFALLAHKDKTTINPLCLEQWRFYVLPTRVLDARTRSQHSITLASLERLAGASHAYNELSCAVKLAGFDQLGVSIT